MIYDRSRTCHGADFCDPRGVWQPRHDPVRSLAAATAASGADVLRRDWDVYRDRKLARPGYHTPQRAGSDRTSRRRQACSELARAADAAEAHALERISANDLPGAYADIWASMARLERRIASAARAALHHLETHP